LLLLRVPVACSRAVLRARISKLADERTVSRAAIRPIAARRSSDPACVRRAAIARASATIHGSVFPATICSTLG
jgi:hypothetical protein